MRITVILVFAACSNSPHIAADAPSAPDGATADVAIAIDAPSGPPIQITVYDYNNPETPFAGAMVEFIAPDQSMSTATTDANGVAMGYAPPHSTVVAIQDGGNGPLVRSFADVMPGDSIIAGRRPRQAFDALGDITFVLPVFAGAPQYMLTVSCTSGPAISGGTTFTVAPSHCPNATHASAVAIPTDASGVPLGGASTLTGLDFTALAGTTVTMPAYAAGPITITSNFTNLPANSAPEWEEAYSFDQDVTTFAYASSNPAAAQMTLVGVGTRTLSRLTFQVPGFNPVRYEQVDASRLTAFSVDASMLIRPVLTPHYDKATNAVVWTESITGRPATIVNAFVTVQGPSGPVKVEMELHGPHGATPSLPVPPLPVGLAIGLDDTVTVSLIPEIIEGASYDALVQTVDSSFGFTPVYWDPTFVGMVWTAE